MNKLFIFLLLISGISQGSEISLVSAGWNKTEYKPKTDSDPSFSHLEMKIEGRYSMQLDDRYFAMAQGKIQGQHYNGDESLSDGFNIKVGGGIRYFFDKLHERISPYAGAMAEIGTEDDVSAFEIARENGIYYGANLGIRISLSSDFFMEIENQLFKNPLYAVRKITNIKHGSEVSTTYLYTFSASTQTSLRNASISIGMRI